MDDKQVAVKEASDAAVSEVSFFLAANPILDKIVHAVNRAAESAGKLAVLEQGILQPTPAEPVNAVPANKTELNPDTTNAMKKRGIDLAWVGFALPLLINNEARGYLASFLGGLIGVENLEAINSGLKIATIALGAYFGVMIFKQVSDTINTFIRLSQLMGILFNIVNDAEDGIDEEKKKHDKDKSDHEKSKKKNRQTRKDRRAGRLKRLKDVKKARKVIGTLKKALLVGGPIGIALGIASGILIDSMIDYATGDQEADIEAEDKADTGDEEPEVATPEQSEISKFGNVLIKNVVDAFDFVQIAKDAVSSISSLFGGKDKKGDTPKMEDDKEDTSAATKPQIVSTPSASPAKPATSESKPKVSNVTAVSVPAPAPAKQEAAKPISDGSSLQQTSEVVAAEKKDQAKSDNVIINNVNNQTVIVAKPEDNTNPTVAIPSNTVGR